MAQTRTHQFKLVLLGESAVGKSCLVLRFVKGHFSENQESTIGAAFLTQTVRVNEENAVKFEIWDTAGQERYKSLAPMYYRNANCAVVVFDVTQRHTLEKAKSWVKELNQRGLPGITIALAGNKTDLESARTVPYDEAKAYADEAGLLFWEVSALDGTNVSELFQDIAKKLPLDQPERRRDRGEVDVGETETSEAGCFCR